jgi:CYTH domain-containing protein
MILLHGHTFESIAGEFEPPDWLGEEVTEDSRYKNQTLAQKGAPQSKVMRPR